MLFTIGYSLIFLLYAGITFNRIRKKTFSAFLNEEVGFVIMFIIVSLIVEVPTQLKAICVPILLLVFIYGCFRK
ncbi:hypothetical protein GCM10010917_31300 [Paenibacillus physcomitrellae]|uniref:Uncharacterized protein n=1 Tax=Paenibacillus physcomitrellae TaxID=1619311 RepID=A0ABQ1GH45_9BACL|nr:hypothetical protein GCM10010917_31300 [Paenibacillus physcomitrellae]